MAASSSSDIVTINVGGRLFTALRSTLSLVPDSTLALMLSDRWPNGGERDDEGRLFLDVDPDLFAACLAWLRRAANSSKLEAAAAALRRQQGQGEAAGAAAAPSPSPSSSSPPGGGRGHDTSCFGRGSSSSASAVMLPLTPPPERLDDLLATLDFLQLHRHVPLAYNETFNAARHSPFMAVHGSIATRAGAAAQHPGRPNPHGRRNRLMQFAVSERSFFDVRVDVALQVGRFAEGTPPGAEGGAMPELPAYMFLGFCPAREAERLDPGGEINAEVSKARGVYGWLTGAQAGWTVRSGRRAGEACTRAGSLLWEQGDVLVLSLDTRRGGSSSSAAAGPPARLSLLNQSTGEQHTLVAEPAFGRARGGGGGGGGEAGAAAGGDKQSAARRGRRPGPRHREQNAAAREMRAAAAAAAANGNAPAAGGGGRGGGNTTAAAANGRQQPPPPPKQKTKEEQQQEDKQPQPQPPTSAQEYVLLVGLVNPTDAVRIIGVSRRGQAPPPPPPSPDCGLDDAAAGV